MKCRIKTIISTASVVALTAAAAPAANIYAASIDEVPAVISENVGEEAPVTRLATASETITWNKAQKLTEDTVVDGNLNITAEVDLNGFSLTVNGDINHTAGAITCKGGTLNINGTYNMGRSGSYTSPDLILSDNHDTVNINGDLVILNINSKHGLLQNAGIVSVSGNINASSGFVMSTENYTALVLNGDSDQNVYFGNCPTLNVLKVDDPEKREIVWKGNMNVKDIEGNINVKSDGLHLGNIDLTFSNMVVNGNCDIAGKVDINGGDLTINGDLTHISGSIICNTGTLNVNGTYNMGRKGEYTSPDLILSDNHDTVNINGDLVILNINSEHGLLQNAGIVYVSGNINAGSGFVMSTENYTALVLNGASDQSVYFGNCPTLNVLKVNDPDEREIIWKGKMNVKDIEGDINVKSEDLLLGNIDLTFSNMVVNGNCDIAGKVDINGGDLTINGDLTHITGTIYCNTGALNVNGTYHMGRNAEYTSPDLILSDNHDEVKINGDLDIRNIKSEHGILQNAGLVTVSGNINAGSGFAMSTENYTALVLNGASDQSVYFGNCSTLNVLKVDNPEKREIIWKGNMNVKDIEGNINVKSDGLHLGNIDLTFSNMVVNGNCDIAGKVDINGGDLTINGDLTHITGTIYCNTGALNVNGTYHMGRNAEYTSPDLILSDNHDTVNINGDLDIRNIKSEHGILQNAGLVTVSGNINAGSGFVMNTDNYTALVLNGMSKQKINLPKGTKINVLVINKFLSCYEFNQKDCWNELITDYPANYPAVTIKKWEKGYGAVKLTWDAVPGAEKYAIATYVNGKWTVLNEGYKTSYIIKGLNPGVKYKVAVVAKIGGKWYLDVSKAIVVTPKIVNRYPVVTSDVSGKQILLNWKPADGAEKYAIAVYQSGKWVVKVQLNGDVTSYTSPKLNNGTYKIAVCAKVDGKWDVSNINNRAINVTIK